MGMKPPYETSSCSSVENEETFGLYFIGILSLIKNTMELENSSPVTVSAASGEATASSLGNQIQDTQLAAGGPPKKKRNLPGMPDPDAEVIALSPKTLLATNRFVCEICNKGFQRDQNLQLHRRGHNLPWKLRQRTSKEIRKRVYVCPEPSCVHHNPARALGDLTGIKKHFCRKHGEKKWKCERCSKKYAVQSDWKAHMKTCGTREYKCDCGAIFSRRDSFITHRAFCDALAEESAKAQTVAVVNTEVNVNANGNGGGTIIGGADAATSPPPRPLTPSTSVVFPGLSIQSSETPGNAMGFSPATPAAVTASTSNANVFSSMFAPNSQPSNISAPLERTSLSLSSPLYLSNNGSSIFTGPENDHCHYAPTPQLPMSATALLQKAAQMGAAASNPSLLRGLGLTISSAPSAGQDLNAKSDSNRSSGLTNPMIDSSSLFGNKPTTLDLLGLGMANGVASSNGLSALLASFGGGFNVGATTMTTFGAGGSNSPRETWDGAPEIKLNGPTML
ncbi:zinc finger protein GAI-ASSOCIATED FACTOR 1-like isoform X2 [Hibiscus syriacus]|uniref:zinc finger protein GAI-ASSOCIATED FACTOR 1-like isoform X2 n=1 Tax=Hibiscus syriacus TaxID=106335 RepID=UPI0019223676|nr:zinc finger protein GAI-ASSOCIATED FACTOR 1-like isoform X2 [Hibiscus syriacus]